jgi:hypothetical protein
VNNFMAVSFTQALLIFTIIQIILYLLMLMTVDKRADIPIGEFSRHKSSYILVNSLDKISFTVSSIGLTLTLLTNFRETTPYFIILSLVLLTSTLYIILRGPSGLILGSLTLWHLTMYLGKIPAIDIAVGEGSGMVREMRLNDHWDFRWAHNRSYNPIPTVAFIQATLSRITTMDWYSYSLGLIVFLAVLIAYDLAIYTLTYAVTRNSRIALLSIPLVAITPETPIHQHPYQWSGNALVLTATALLINVIRGEEPRINFLAITLLFTGAIFAHVTGLSYPFLLATLLLMKVAFKYLPQRGGTEVMFSTRQLTLILSVLLVILIVRSVYTHGYLAYIYPSATSIFQGLINLIKEFLTPSEEISEVVHIPLYERAGVYWIQAYVWSFALSIATAYILYSLIKGKINLVEFTLYTTCALFIGVAFIGYGLLKMPSFYYMNRTTYVFIPLVYPLAAKTLAKILEGISCSSIRVYFIIALLGLTLFIAAAPIASQDPNISPIQYAKAREMSQFEINIALLLKASIVISLIQPVNIDVLGVYSENLFIEKIVYTSAGLKTEYLYSNPLIKAMELYSFINGIRVPKLEVPGKNTYESDKVFDLGEDLYVFS